MIARRERALAAVDPAFVKPHRAARARGRRPARDAGRRSAAGARADRARFDLGAWPIASPAARSASSSRPRTCAGALDEPDAAGVPARPAPPGRRCSAASSSGACLVTIIRRRARSDPRGRRSRWRDGAQRRDDASQPLATRVMRERASRELGAILARPWADCRPRRRPRLRAHVRERRRFAVVRRSSGGYDPDCRVDAHALDRCRDAARADARVEEPPLIAPYHDVYLSEPHVTSRRRTGR